MGSVAFLMGRAIARTWRSFWWVGFYSLGLGFVDRFLVFALFQGDLLSGSGYIVDTVAIFTAALFAYRINFVSVLVQQYPWVYKKTSWLTYEKRFD